MNEHFSKNALIDEISKENGLTKVETEKVVNLFIEKIKEHLRNGEKVTIPKFATFSTKVVAERAYKINGKEYTKPANIKFSAKMSKFNTKEIQE